MSFPLSIKDFPENDLHFLNQLFTGFTHLVFLLVLCRTNLMKKVYSAENRAQCTTKTGSGKKIAGLDYLYPSFAPVIPKYYAKFSLPVLLNNMYL